MRLNLLVVALATSACAHPAVYIDSPLSVTLELTNSTQVGALVVNKGAKPLKLFRTGSLLDSQLVASCITFVPMY